MKKLYFLSAVIFLLISSNASAQQHVDRCGTMQHLQMQMQQDPGLQARMQAIEAQTQQFVANWQPNANRSVITIPVVFHVVYSTSAQNIADAFLLAQIDQLNLDYARQNTDASNTPSAFQSAAANTGIQFCLASRDPNGNTTTGITRTSTNTSSWSTNDNVKHANSGGADAWPAGSYLNIWVCNLGGGLLGYTQFPGGAAATDGVVVLYSSVGSMAYPSNATPYNLGRTATHEVGHWLNLYHVWGDDGGSCSGSDNVSDTPNQGSENYGCPSFPHTDNCSGSSPGVMFMNYMDYTDDNCMNMFTQGQTARMQALFAPGGARVSILSSTGCQALTAPPVASFSANTTSSCTGLIQFTDESSNNPSSWAWTFGDGGSSTQQNPTHTYTTNGTFTVTLTAVNQYGNNTATQTSYITVNKPSVPSVTGGSRCGTGTVTLTANSSDVIRWFDSPTAVTPIATANPFVTPVISTTTTYYVEDSVPGAVTHVGPTTNATLGGGGYFSNSTDRYLTFDVLGACNLKSVVVYSQSAATRTIELRNSGGTVLQSYSATLASGANTVTLNFPLTVGTGYILGINGTANLYRNNAVTGYPFTAANLVSITGSNAGSGYYYFYDWQVETPGCVSQRGSVTATVTGGPSATVGAHTDVSCYGGANGSATLSVNGGTPAYTYVWSNNQTSATISNVAQGTYTVTITDATGCSGTSSVSIAQPTQLSATTTTTAASCGQTNGAVNTSVSGGTSGYTYHWSNNATSANLSNVAAGTYTVTVTDAHSCSTTASASVSSGGSFSISANSSATSCYGGNNGSASLTVSGGTPGYTYLWSNNQTGAQLSNVASGTYSVTVTDAGGCSAIQSVTISQPTQLSLNATASSAGCGQSNGSVTTTVSGGTSGYTYLWSNNATTANLSNVASGNYQLTATDAHGCTVTVTAVVTNNGSFNVTPSAVSVSCYGNSNGSASVSVSGGTPNYSYLWSNGGTNSSITNVAAGTYTVTITDAGGCNSTAAATVNQPAAINVTATSTSPACGAANNGLISVTVSGGNGGYTYLWNTGASSSSISNLAAGTYTVTVTDASSCSTVSSTTLTGGSAAINVSSSSANATCFGTSTGSAAVTATGGGGSYTYSWSNGATTPSISNVAAGSYTVIVTDNNQCTAGLTVNVTQPADIQAAVSGTDATTGINNGTATIGNISGGTPPYSITWSDGQNGPIAVGLAPGNYTATVTDNNGCTSQVGVTISQTTGIATVATAPSFSVYPNPAKDEITVMMYTAQPVTFSIKNELGQAVMSEQIQPNMQFNYFDVSNVASGVYYAEVVSNGQPIVRQLVITK